MPPLPMPAVKSLGLDALCQWEKRALFNVGLGCPSFGGQRTARDSSRLLLAGLVTCRKSSLFAKRPSSHVVSAFQRRRYGMSLCRFTLTALGRPVAEIALHGLA